MERQKDLALEQEETRRGMARLGESSRSIKVGNGLEGSQIHVNIVFKKNLICQGLLLLIPSFAVFLLDKTWWSWIPFIEVHFGIR